MKCFLTFAAYLLFSHWAAGIVHAGPRIIRTFESGKSFFWEPRLDFKFDAQSSAQTFSETNGHKILPTFGGIGYGRVKADGPSPYWGLDLEGGITHEVRVTPAQTQLDDSWSIAPKLTGHFPTLSSGDRRSENGKLQGFGEFLLSTSFGFKHAYTRITGKPIKVVDSPEIGFGIGYAPSGKFLVVGYEYKNNMRGGTDRIHKHGLVVTVRSVDFMNYFWPAKK